ncbi:MAG: 4Fe-4S dicluster domain-containing protein [Chloroflexi bacterium]|nr:4Fe-4S dicluster domain-containing protein [Chloroflexota bacterium]MBI3734814.1 4Fe-4S dicluster domain-containing protein [Chloroflexota bacterium]
MSSSNPSGIGGAPSELHAPKAKDLSRREFLTTTAAGFVALGAVGLGGFGVLKTPNTSIDRESGGVIFPDPTLCIGCLTCEVACTDAHKKAGLSSVSRIRIFDEPATQVDPEVLKNYPGRGSFIQAPCLQCPESPCLPVCPVNALQIEPKTGARVINEQTCIACGRCAQACPFEVRAERVATNQLTVGQKTRITYDPLKNVFTKCDLCYFRPEGPACIERCPINIRIKQGILKSDRMCLDGPKSDQAHFLKLRDQQTVKPA